MNDLVEELLNGDKRAAARLITIIENNDEEKNRLMQKLYAHTGHAYIVGITGSPGAGKSTLTDKLIGTIRKAGLKVGVIAIDPTSPFTGGAILGDRIRMQDHALDPDVFMRSMGTRGSLGGLSQATHEAVQVLDAFKKDVIIIETVGVGQSEYDIMHIANTTLVVLTPGAGDAVQTIKAGIMEIADVFVVNKGDLAGADGVKMEVEAMLGLKAAKDWQPPVIKTIGKTGEGVDELWQKVLDHQSYLKSSGVLLKQRKKQLLAEVKSLLAHKINKHIWREVELTGELEKMTQPLYQREIDPYTAADKLLAAHFKLS